MSTIQMLNMTFDVWSALFSLILIVAVLVQRRQERSQAFSLVGALGANMLVNVSEVVAYAFRGNTSAWGYWLIRSSNFSVFLFNHLLLLFAALFVFSTIEKGGEHVSALARQIIVALVLLGILLLAASRLFGFYYAFDEQNRYYRLGSYPIMVLLQGVAILVLLQQTVTHRNALESLEYSLASWMKCSSVPSHMA